MHSIYSLERGYKWSYLLGKGARAPWERNVCLLMQQGQQERRRLTGAVHPKPLKPTQQKTHLQLIAHEPLTGYTVPRPPPRCARPAAQATSSTQGVPPHDSALPPGLLVVSPLASCQGPLTLFFCCAQLARELQCPVVLHLWIIDSPCMKQ